MPSSEELGGHCDHGRRALTSTLRASARRWIATVRARHDHRSLNAGLALPILSARFLQRGRHDLRTRRSSSAPTGRRLVPARQARSGAAGWGPSTRPPRRAAASRGDQGHARRAAQAARHGDARGAGGRDPRRHSPPGLVRVYECALLPDHRPWIAMELVEGETLAQPASSLTARCPRTRSRRCSPRSPTCSRPCTRAASCIAISSPTTCSSRRPIASSRCA